MVVPAILNVLLSLVGFLTGLHWKSPGANQEMTGDSQQVRRASSNSLKSYRKARILCRRFITCREADVSWEQAPRNERKLIDRGGPADAAGTGCANVRGRARQSSVFRQTRRGGLGLLGFLPGHNSGLLYEPSTNRFSPLLRLVWSNAGCGGVFLAIVPGRSVMKRGPHIIVCRRGRLSCCASLPPC